MSLIDERSVSEEFFDHYLTSINSGFEIDMKLEYCYDIQRDLYWLTQIQLVSDRLFRGCSGGFIKKKDFEKDCF